MLSGLFSWNQLLSIFTLSFFFFDFFYLYFFQTSGESGAGKTETTKKCLQYLSAVAHSKRSSSSETSDHSPSSTSGIPSSNHQNLIPIEDRVLGTNPLLESFGNSKTARNDNSSRVGKWLEITFVPTDSTHLRSTAIRLTGAYITQYLLEKSRVVFQSEGERNYHIFYQLCADASFGLGMATGYQYLNQSGCVSVEGIDDRAELTFTLKAFNDLLFPGETFSF